MIRSNRILIDIECLDGMLMKRFLSVEKISLQGASSLAVVKLVTD